MVRKTTFPSESVVAWSERICSGKIPMPSFNWTDILRKTGFAVTSSGKWTDLLRKKVVSTVNLSICSSFFTGERTSKWCIFMLHWCLKAPPETERVWGGLCILQRFSLIGSKRSDAVLQHFQSSIFSSSNTSAAISVSSPSAWACMAAVAHPSRGARPASFFWAITKPLTKAITFSAHKVSDTLCSTTASKISWCRHDFACFLPKFVLYNR